MGSRTLVGRETDFAIGGCDLGVEAFVNPVALPEQDDLAQRPDAGPSWVRRGIVPTSECGRAPPDSLVLSST
jgi:hypothetical protein